MNLRPSILYILSETFGQNKDPTRRDSIDN